MAAVRRTSRRRVRRPDELSSLTGAQLELVRLVRRRPGVSVAEAASELGLAPNTVSTLVRQLCDAGFLTRKPDARDRRIARLELRPEIRLKVEAWRDRRIELLASAIVELSASDERRLSEASGVLLRLAAILDSQGRAPDDPTGGMTTPDHRGSAGLVAAP